MTIGRIFENNPQRNLKTWRTVSTNSFLVCGSFPPNVRPEELLSDQRMDLVSKVRKKGYISV